jgi:hypothetical protein
MALTDNGNDMIMPVAPMYGGNGNGFGFGGDWGSLIVLFLIAAMFGGFGGGFGGFGGYGNGMLGIDFPWLLNGQNGINQNTNAGFAQAATQSAIGDVQNAITSGFGDVQTALCGGFAGVNATVNGAQSAITQQMYANQIADMERSFNAQTAITQGQTAIQTQIATEGCATRQTDTANTQAILDKLCQIELDNVKNQVAAEQRENANLRTELMYARGQASQIEQTAILRQGQEAEVDALYNRLKNCPVGTTPVYGNQPIFTCPQTATCGCGCGGNF